VDLAIVVPPSGVIAPTLKSLVGCHKRDATLAGHCGAHVRDHYPLDRQVESVERSLIAPAGDQRGRGMAWS
jgi:hypothetical protein